MAIVQRTGSLVAFLEDTVELPPVVVPPQITHFLRAADVGRVDRTTGLAAPYLEFRDQGKLEFGHYDPAAPCHASDGFL